MTIISISTLFCAIVVGFLTGYYIVSNVVLKKKKAQILKDAEVEGENIKGRRGKF